jgi:3'-phosphoadenosine 5'-phosphosulfate sulfotransferase (PAPS reductase)/FAD synthetase
MACATDHNRRKVARMSNAPATVTAGPTPNLTDYDVILVNSSAGKDSQAALDVVAKTAARAGVSDRVVVVHADLGVVEWEGTRELAEEQAAHYGFRFLVVSRPQGDLLAQVEQRGMWPSSAARYCTSDHKRGQVRKVMTQLADEQRAAGITDRPVRILNVMGFRAQESSARAKRVPYAPAGASNGRRQVDDWYPIHKWTVEMVWARPGIRSRDDAPVVPLLRARVEG